MILAPKRPVDADEWEWQLACFKWLEQEFPELAAYRFLATPDGTCFPDATCNASARGEELFGQVLSICGIGDWPTRLVALPAVPKAEPLNRSAAVQHGKGAAGTFQLMQSEDGTLFAEIRYTLDQLDYESSLVATLAHEAAHYVLHSRSGEIPGGEDVEELLTDLTAVWLGFGIFLGNNARYSENKADVGGSWHMSGWRGYLSERSLMTALALSELLADREPLTAAPYLKPHLATDLRKATAYAQRRDVRGEIRGIELSDYGV